MRVLFNGIPLMPPRTGVGRYVESLCRALAGLDPSLTCDLFTPLGIRSGFRVPASPDPGRASAGARRPGEPRLRPSALVPPARLLAQSLVLTRPFTSLYPWSMDQLFRISTLKRRYDLYHETNYVPRPFDGPTVVTVYDLSLALHPETHPRSRVALFARDFARRIPQVDRFLTLSHAVKEELVALYGIDPGRVSVTPPGVDPETFRPPDDPPGSGRSGGEARGRADAGYLLFVGSLEPRKNLITLVEAYAGIPPGLRREHPLVLVGPRGWKFGPVWARIRQLGLERDVSWRGFLPEDALAVLYQCATALVFPSIYEGFGLPLVEALACATPVLCSDTPSSREVVGEAALRLPALDVEAWRSALERVLADSELRSRLGAAGPARAARFTWTACAGRTLGAYRELVA